MLRYTTETLNKHEHLNKGGIYIEDSLAVACYRFNRPLNTTGTGEHFTRMEEYESSLIEQISEVEDNEKRLALMDALSNRYHPDFTRLYGLEVKPFNTEWERRFLSTGVKDRLEENEPLVRTICSELMTLDISGAYEVWTPSHILSAKRRNTYGLAVSETLHNHIQTLYHELAPITKRTGGSLSFIAGSVIVTIKDPREGLASMTFHVKKQREFNIKIYI